jgi:hypothetical protein
METNGQSVLGDLIKRRAALKKEKAEADALSSRTEKLIAELDHKLIEVMDNLGVTETGDGENKVRITERSLPQVSSPEAWEELVFPYIKEHNAFYLLQKRLSATALRELWGLGKSVPGILPYTDRVIK